MNTSISSIDSEKSVENKLSLIVSLSSQSHSQCNDDAGDEGDKEGFLLKKQRGELKFNVGTLC